MLGRVRCCVISFDSVSGRSVVWTLGLVCWLFCSSRSLVQEVRALTELAAPLRRVLGELGEGGAAGLVAVQGSGCWAASVGWGWDLMVVGGGRRSVGAFARCFGAGGRSLSGGCLTGGVWTVGGATLGPTGWVPCRWSPVCI